MNQWFVYLLRTNSGSLYTGITTDPERRLAEHQGAGGKGARSLRGKGPLTLVFSAEVKDRSEASVLEAKIKKLPKVDKEALVSRQLPLSEVSGV